MALLRLVLSSTLAAGLTAALGLVVVPATEADATPRADAFIARVAPAAMAAQIEKGIPASVTIAQAALESGWGGSDLARHANNFFGIKCSAVRSPRQSGCVLKMTREVVKGRSVVVRAPFRTYTSPQASIDDYVALITSHYRPAMAFSRSPERFVKVVQASGYATDPAYAAEVIAVMRGYDLYRFNRLADASAAAARALKPPAAALRWIVDRNAPPTRVRVLQRVLAAHGYRVSVNGRWDAATANAVRAFQRAHGLRADGVVGPRTWRTF